MHLDEAIDPAYEATQLAHELAVALADLLYVQRRGYSTETVSATLQLAEDKAHMILGILDEVRNRLTVLQAIDRMASVSCGD